MRLLLVIPLLLIGTLVSAQSYWTKNNVYPVKVGDYWTLANDEAIVLSAAKYDTIISLQDGYNFLCKSKGLWGCISPSGDVNVPFKYSRLIAENGGFIAHQGSQCKLLDSCGYALSKSYIDIQPYKGIYKYKTKQGWGLMESDGEVLVTALYNTIGYFGDFILTEKNSKLGAHKRYTGEKLLDCEWEHVLPVVNHNLIRARKNGVWEYFDYSGAMIDRQNDSIVLMTDGYYKLISENDYRLFKHINQPVHASAEYNYAVLNAKYIAIFDDSARVGVIDSSGSMLIEPRFSNIAIGSKEKDEFIFTASTGKQGTCNLYGDTLIPPSYDAVKFHKDVDSSSYYIITHNGHEGLAIDSGKQILPCKYDGVFVVHNAPYVYLYRNNLYGIADLDSGREILGCSFPDVNVVGRYCVGYNGNNKTVRTSTENLCRNNKNVFISDDLVKLYEGNRVVVYEFDSASNKHIKYDYGAIPSYAVVDSAASIHFNRRYPFGLELSNLSYHVPSEKWGAKYNYRTDWHIRPVAQEIHNSGHVLSLNNTKATRYYHVNRTWKTDKSLDYISAGQAGTFTNKHFVATEFHDAYAFNKLFNHHTKVNLTRIADYSTHYINQLQYCEPDLDYKAKLYKGGKLVLSTVPSPETFGDYYARVFSTYTVFPDSVEVYRELLNDSTYVHPVGGKWSFTQARFRESNRNHWFGTEQFDFTANHQDKYFPFKRNGRFGVVSDSNKIIMPEFYDTLISTDGKSAKFVAAIYNSKEAVYTLSGEKLMDLDDVYAVKSNHFASYDSDGKYRIRNTKAEVVAESDEKIYPLSEVLCYQLNKRELTVLNHDQDTLVKVGADEINRLSDKLYSVHSKNRVGILTASGKWLEKIQYAELDTIDNMIRFVGGGSISMYSMDGENMFNGADDLSFYIKGGLMVTEKRGKVILKNLLSDQQKKLRRTNIHRVHSGGVVLSHNGTYSFITKYNLNRSKEYQEVDNIIEQVVSYMDGNNWIIEDLVSGEKDVSVDGSIWQNGNKISYYSPDGTASISKYRAPSVYKKELIEILHDGRLAGVEKDGKTIIPFEYREGRRVDDYYLMRYPSLWGSVSRFESDKTVPFVHDAVHYSDNRFYTFKSDQLSIYDLDGNKLWPKDLTTK